MSAGGFLRKISGLETRLDRSLVNAVIDKVNAWSAMCVDKRFFALDFIGGIPNLRWIGSVSASSLVGWEWFCSYTGGLIVTVSTGDIPWGNSVDNLIMCPKDEGTPPMPIAVDVDFADVPENQYRWVYCEYRFQEKTCTAKLAPTDNVMALPDPKNLVGVRNLTLWYRGASSLTYIRTHHSGGISIYGESAPPLS